LTLEGAPTKFAAVSATLSGHKTSSFRAGTHRVGSRVQSLVASLVVRPWFWVLFVALTFVLPLYKAFTRRVPKAPPPLAQLGDFELVDQIGRRVGTEELEGVVWCVGFTAMSESEHGDALTRSMAKIRFRTRNLSGAFHLVTVTLDPERDTIAARDAYAQRFHAAAPSWSFLGGDVPAVQSALARFELSTDANPSMAEFSRRERLVLVDKQGKIRGYYTTDPDALDAIVADIGLLANDAP
jgi:protein SCO1/2